MEVLVCVDIVCLDKIGIFIEGGVWFDWFIVFVLVDVFLDVYDDGVLVEVGDGFWVVFVWFGVDLDVNFIVAVLCEFFMVVLVVDFVV